MNSVDPIHIGLIRKTMPQMIARDICGIQPMTGYESLFTKVSYKTAEEIAAEDALRSFGEMIHQFCVGWHIWTGSKWMLISDFVEKYGSEPLVNLDEV